MDEDPGTNISGLYVFYRLHRDTNEDEASETQLFCLSQVGDSKRPLGHMPFRARNGCSCVRSNADKLHQKRVCC